VFWSDIQHCRVSISPDKKVWLTTVGSDLEVTKTDPVCIGLNNAVTVRPGGGTNEFDGAWLKGERSYDTCVCSSTARGASPSVNRRGYQFVGRLRVDNRATLEHTTGFARPCRHGRIRRAAESGRDYRIGAVVKAKSEEF
jgi:hypothetical protein